MQQKFTVAQRLVVKPVALVIRADVQIADNYFRTFGYLGIAVLHVGFARAQRFYFRTRQGNACFVSFVNGKIMARFSVFCNNFYFLFQM